MVHVKIVDDLESIGLVYERFDHAKPERQMATNKTKIKNKNSFEIIIRNRSNNDIVYVYRVPTAGAHNLHSAQFSFISSRVTIHNYIDINLSYSTLQLVCWSFFFQRNHL